MKKLMLCLFLAVLLALPAMMIKYSLFSSSRLLQQEHAKQLQTRLSHDLQTQLQLTPTLFEITQQFSSFLSKIGHLAAETSWPDFAGNYAESAFADFSSTIARQFRLPFEMSLIFYKLTADRQMSFINAVQQSCSLDLLTATMRQLQPIAKPDTSGESCRQAQQILRQLRLYCNLDALCGAYDRSDVSHLVIREAGIFKLFLSVRSNLNLLMNAIFDLKDDNIQLYAQRRIAKWSEKEIGLMFFGGGAGMTPVYSEWFSQHPELRRLISRPDTDIVQQRRFETDDFLVLRTPFDPKYPWQAAIATPLPAPPKNTGLKILLALFSIGGCIIWKILVEQIIFQRKINFSLRTFIIMVFAIAAMLPITSGIYLTNEYVIANFKVQKNKVAEELSSDLLDLDLTTFSQFRDSINRAKGLDSIESIASFTGLPATTPVNELMIACMLKLWQMKGIPCYSELWYTEGSQDLAEIEYKFSANNYFAKHNNDDFIKDVFIPRFRIFFEENQKTTSRQNDSSEQISYDEVKSEILDSILLNMFGDETYFNLQKNLETLIRLEAFYDSNAVMSVPVSLQGRLKYIFSYVFSSPQIRNHFPKHRFNVDTAKPVLIGIFGNDQLLQAEPENIKMIAEKLPTLTGMARRSFLSTSRMVMHDVNASGSPVFETLPARYSDYIICGQRNTRSLESINSELSLTASRILAMVAITALLLALLASVYFTIPIRQLTKATQKIIAADYSVRLGEDHPDEFAQSAIAFNKMASALGEGQLLKQFVSASVREDLTISAGQAQVEETTILFSSIKNFADLQRRLEPEKLFALMQTHLSAAVAMAGEFGGEIDKMIEDKVMIVFPHRNDRSSRAAVAALKAAAHIRTTMQNVCGQQIAIGINSGEVVSGTLGAANVRLARTVVGDTVNLAARLASVAAGLAEGGIVVAGATVELAGNAFNFEKLAINRVKGKTHAVEAFLASTDVN